MISESFGTNHRNDLWVAEIPAADPGNLSLQPVQQGIDVDTSGRIGPDGLLYPLTTLNAPRRRLCRTRPTSPGSWEAVVPEDPGGATLDEFAVLAGEVVVARTRDGGSELLAFPGGLPAGASRRETWPEPRTAADASASVTVTRSRYPASDEATVRVTVLQHRDLRPGAAPTILHVYGGHGAPRRLGLSASLLAWLESGGRYAIAHVRGGGEDRGLTMAGTALFTDRFHAQAGADFAAERLGEEFVRVDVGDDAARDLLTRETLNDLLTTIGGWSLSIASPDEVEVHLHQHDTMIVQLAGEKHWTVHGMGRHYPMKVDSDRDHEAPDTVVWEGVLRPGEILHVPRGWWHTVRGTGEMSMHLTFGFTRRTGVDWAAWVVEKLHDEELFRRDLPRFAPKDRRQSHHDELMRSLAKLVAEHPPEEFLAHRDRRFPRRPEINLPWPVRFEPPPEDARLVSTALRDPVMNADDRAVSVTVAGRTFRFAPVLAPMLNHLVRRRYLTVAELRAHTGLEEDTFLAAVELLVRNHLVVIRTAEGSPS